MEQIDSKNNTGNYLSTDNTSTSFSDKSKNNDPDNIKQASKNTDTKPSFYREIPYDYGDNKIVLMVRDPLTLYTYWEIKDSVEEAVRDEIKNRGLTPLKSILRVYDVTGSSIDDDLKGEMDFELRGWVSTWYVHTGKADSEWMVDIGILCTSGEFFCLARSNVVRTPRNSMSEIICNEWMSPEALRTWLSSGSISSGMFGGASSFNTKK